MSKSLGTTWNMDPHTAKKHEILRSYFQAWLPIMSKFNPKLVYIDGFAGPGSYMGGEDGSPLVVLKAARDHFYPIGSELTCIFVEENDKRRSHLRLKVAEVERELPSYLTYKVVDGTADQYLQRTFGDERAKNGIDPTFVFVDPFGFTQTPFTSISNILRSPKCEVLINFMYEEVNRFLKLDAYSEEYDKLFGSSEWRRIPSDAPPKERKDAIRRIYSRQLRTAAKYVHSFEMLNLSNSTDYFLFFATNSLRGLEKMKEAMWGVDESGGYRFSDYKSSTGLQSLFSEHPNLEPLKGLLVERFTGKEVTIEEITDWVIAETPFLRSHLKGLTLKPMEESGHLTVTKGGAVRRKGSFPDGCVIHFK